MEILLTGLEQVEHPQNITLLELLAIEDQDGDENVTWNICIPESDP